MGIRKLMMDLGGRTAYIALALLCQGAGLQVGGVPAAVGPAAVRRLLSERRHWGGPTRARELLRDQAGLAGAWSLGSQLRA